MTSPDTNPSIQTPNISQPYGPSSKSQEKMQMAQIMLKNLQREDLVMLPLIVTMCAQARFFFLGAM